MTTATRPGQQKQQHGGMAAVHVRSAGAPRSTLDVVLLGVVTKVFVEQTGRYVVAILDLPLHLQGRKVDEVAALADLRDNSAVASVLCGLSPGERVAFAGALVTEDTLEGLAEAGEPLRATLGVHAVTVAPPEVTKPDGVYAIQVDAGGEIEMRPITGLDVSVPHGHDGLRLWLSHLWMQTPATHAGPATMQ